jgi:UDP-hydrolysing UDP-N-acetyl-D-glucosamine 2-epimerase
MRVTVPASSEVSNCARTVAVITGARSDYGLMVPLLRAIERDPILALGLWVTGMHFSRQFGSSIEEIATDGFCIAEKIDMLLASDTPEAVAKSLGVGLLGFGQAYARNRPDILVGLGDRFEVLAAVLAALPFNIPVLHICGGETTEGAMDESIRHSITKLSHLHCVATEPYARRVIQMGEEPWRVHVTGEPGLDNIETMDVQPQAEVEKRIDMSLSPPPLLVTFHPVTLEYDQNGFYIKELLAALKEIGQPAVITYPNADAAGGVIIEEIEAYAISNSNVRVVRSLGRSSYCSLMRHAAAMVGNSSSGILEAASFELPVVNIGNRQKGRLAGGNVIHCDCRRGAIVDSIRKATSPSFRSSIRGIRNLYGDGHASERIVSLLKNTALDQKLIMKHFYDIGDSNELAMNGGLNDPAKDWVSKL